MSGLLFFSGLMLLETRADIKEFRVANAAIGLRVTVIETGIPLQFEVIKEWRQEIKMSLEKITTAQEKTNSRLDKSAVTLGEWKKIK